MTDQEIELIVRERYKNEPDGVYEINSHTLMGKELAIEYEIELIKQVRDFSV